AIIYSIFIQLIGLPNITPYIPLIYGLWTDLGLIVGFHEILMRGTMIIYIFMVWQARTLRGYIMGRHNLILILCCLPASYKEAKKLIKALGLGYEWKDGDARNKSPQKIEEDWHKLKRKETLTENIIGFKKILEI
ncbi:hypothetical protein ACJX0J_030938, partial [Zea mays]